MHRAALVIASALLATAVAGCQGQQVKLLEDPDEILAAAVTATTAATSVHVDLKAEGTLAVDLLGSGAQGEVNLVGTTLAADLDIAGQETRATFSAPNLFGLAGEVVLADDTLFIKSTLTGPKFRPSALGAPPENPLKGLADLMARTDLDPVKGPDVPCAGGTCYTLSIRLTADELIDLGGGVQLPTDLPIPLPDMSGAAVDLTLHVEQVTTRLSGITAEVDLGDTGDLTLEATFTRWNEPLDIAPPPGDQVEGTG
jgi:hypothetical protein